MEENNLTGQPIENSDEQPRFSSRIDLSDLSESVNAIKQEMAKNIVGQEEAIELMIAAMLSNGHILVEGVPGLAKTMMSRIFAATVAAKYSRIQFTPDLMPPDVLGTSVFNFKNSEFEFKKGPIFGNILLIDEINRAPAKTQAALFEVMEERQVTIDGNTYKMESPFMVFATQNPVEHEGTYRLPEAQLDRFLFKIEVQYPSINEEVSMLERFAQQTNYTNIEKIKTVVTPDQIKRYKEKLTQVVVEEKLLRYIAELMSISRDHKDLYLGGSPRASLAILSASKSIAAIKNRDFVTPDDIALVAKPVLRHRIMLSPEKEMEGSTANDVVEALLKQVEIPR